MQIRLTIAALVASISFGGASANDDNIKWGAKFFPLKREQQVRQNSGGGGFFAISSVKIHSTVKAVKAQPQIEIDDLDEELPKDIAVQEEYQRTIKSVLPKSVQAWPFRKGDGERVTSVFGWRKHPVTREYAFHQGLDIAAPVGTPVLASADGVVDEVGTHGNLGKYVKLKHADGTFSVYGHLKNWIVESGKKVRQGMKIAEVGVTGRTTGPHLHYSITVDGKAVDPRRFLKKNLPYPEIAMLSRLDNL